jgi:hypothetical protein
MLLEDGRHRIDHVLDAFVRRQQPKREEHGLSLHLEEILVEVRVDERHVDHAMRDHIDLLRSDRVHGLESIRPRSAITMKRSESKSSSFITLR